MAHRRQGHPAGRLDRRAYMVACMALAVEAEQLVKRFTGRSGTVDAVRGVDLHVAAGEVFGFLGPNGAGKSTTVRMLTTLTTITSVCANAESSVRGWRAGVTRTFVSHALRASKPRT